MIQVGVSLAIFFILTTAYYLLKHFFIDKQRLWFTNIANLFLMTYLFLVVGSQLVINVKNSADHCNGVPQFGTAFMYTILPNILIFGLVLMVMQVLPGWKAPFSNTIGYLFVWLGGAEDAYKDLIKNGKSPLISRILDNKSTIINEMTPFNFGAFMSRMAKEGALKNNYKTKSSYNTLFNFILAKDTIAELVWVLVTGILVIISSFNSLIDIQCDIPTKQKQAVAAKFKAEMAKINADKPKEKYFTKHD